jgi:diaminohydroxyphosphoribosylaminopyrimidine deaminase/5-amino-6-(5-phosphoribosylamino)uracil reductase
MDAIVIGIGTALADDPRLTARPAGPRVATRVVLDGLARLPTEGNLARTARQIPVIVAISDRAPSERVERLVAIGCEVIRLPESSPGSIALVPMLDELGRRGMTNVLVEGGGRTIGSFFDAGQVDEVDVFVAPIIEGGSHDFTPARGLGVARIAESLRLDSTTIEQVDGDLRIRGRLAATRHGETSGLDSGGL